MKNNDLMELYLNRSYSPIRVMIGVPEILEIRHILTEIDCGKCIVDLGGGGWISSFAYW